MEKYVKPKVKLVALCEALHTCGHDSGLAL
jgi:hypothetical protein